MNISNKDVHMKKYIGCDLGGTNLRAAIVDVETGDVLHHMSIPTRAREGHDAVMKRMADLFDQVIQAAGMKKDGIGGIGVEIGEIHPAYCGQIVVAG